MLSRKYRFHYSTHRTKIVETSNAKFIENGEVSVTDQSRNIIFQYVRVQVPLPITSKEGVVPTIVESSHDGEQQTNDQSLHDEVITN